MADIGGGFLENCHDLFVKDGSTMALYVGYVKFWLSAGLTSITLPYILMVNYNSLNPIYTYILMVNYNSLNLIYTYNSQIIIPPKLFS
jgi:hypothetical protein